MLKDRKELEQFLSKKCDKINFNNETCIKIREYMLDKYEIPTGTTMDMISRYMFDEQTEFLLFCLLDGIDATDETNYKEEYFTKIEIEQYLNEKFEIRQIHFPLVIKCEKVNDSQWIGATNSQFFMDLRRAQLIKYNVNAQRVMKKIVRGENILFKIVPNKIAIKAIKALMQKNQYIPTPITLNIPYDSDADFYYDEKERELVIKSLDNFDISDGYHRYLAMCELHDEEPDIQYPMEIRIINFTDEKTRQFIFQEDQKTKMSQSNSRTMNINRASNNVIDRLNEMATFDFKGLIGRNSGTINYAALSDFIEYFYFKEKRPYNNSDIIRAANDIKGKFNALSEFDPVYIDKIYGFKELAIMFVAFDIESDLSKAIEKIDNAFKNEVQKEIKNVNVNKTLINTVSKLI